MQRYYSPSTEGFHSDFINGPRRIEETLTPRERRAGKRPRMIDNPACTIPADAIVISEERFEALMRAQAEGKAITAIGGNPVAVERTSSPAEAAAIRRRQRDKLLAASDWTQLPDSPLTEEARAAWGEYRQALRDLDMNGTGWPDQPGA